MWLDSYERISSKLRIISSLISGYHSLNQFIQPSGLASIPAWANWMNLLGIHAINKSSFLNVPSHTHVSIGGKL